MAPICWRPWSAEAFARARAEDKPVLLSIAPSWCHFSYQMDRTSYSDRTICEIVNDRFVPVRVDADRRPDVSERYTLGGWPTTAFLTSDGYIIGGGTHLDPATLADVLQRVADAVRSGRHLGGRSARRAIDRRGSEKVAVEQLSSEIFDNFDPVHGGFGGSPKFPHVAPIRLALERFRESGSERYYDIAVRSLDAIGWGPLHDDVHGGFFSYANAADWSDPHEAKRLDVNAALLVLYVEALETLGLTRYGERAEDVLRYTQTWLADPVDGGWAGSQRTHTDIDASDVSPESGTTVDRTLYCDWNATMVSASLRAGRVLDDSSLSDFAIKSLERVLLLCYKPGGGVAHYVEDGAGKIRGLLDDQLAMASANLDAFDMTGNVVYQMMAQEIAFYMTRALWDAEAGAFVDRAVDPRRDIGLLREPIVPFAANCQAAHMLGRLAKTANATEFEDYSVRALAAMSQRASSEGLLAAEYVLAARAPAIPVIDSHL